MLHVTLLNRLFSKECKANTATTKLYAIVAGLIFSHATSSMQVLMGLRSLFYARLHSNLADLKAIVVCFFLHLIHFDILTCT